MTGREKMDWGWSMSYSSLWYGARIWGEPIGRRVDLPWVLATKHLAASSGDRELTWRRLSYIDSEFGRLGYLLLSTGIQWLPQYGSLCRQDQC